jgi:hypothetical protein
VGIWSITSFFGWVLYNLGKFFFVSEISADLHVGDLGHCAQNATKKQQMLKK